MDSDQKFVKADCQEAGAPETIIKNSQDDKAQQFREYCLFFNSICVDQNIQKYTINPTDQLHRGNHCQNIQSQIRQKLASFQSLCYEELLQNEFCVKNSNSTQEQVLDSLFQMKVVRNLITWEVVEIYCRLGRIFKKFIVLSSSQKLSQNNQMYRYQTTLHGGIDVTVFLLEWLNKQYALKRVQFQPPLINKKQISLFQICTAKTQSFKMVVKEYFIASIMSALKIGPYIKKINGFDFIIHDSFIEFHMEQCHQLHQDQFENQLKENLLKMHSIKICHNDIAPKNIMFSPTFNKSVFIDFGISRILNEEVGQKSLTRYCGSPGYGSLQMQSLLGKSLRMYINLYKNDVHGLNKSIQQLNKKRKPIKEGSKVQPLKQIKLCYTLFDTYLQLLKIKLGSELQQNEIQQNESVFKNLYMKKNYHKQLLIRSCKFFLYCFHNYFWNAQPYLFINEDKKKKVINIIKMIQQLNSDLRTFKQLFNPYFDQHQLIQYYQKYFIESNLINNQIDIHQKINEWSKFYFAVTLSNQQKSKLFDRQSFDFYSQVIKRFSDLPQVQQSIYDPKHIFQYLRFLFILADFTSSREFVTNDLREKVFEIYAIVRKQLLVRIKPTSPNHSTENHSKFYPNSLYSSQCIPEILQFYDDMLTVTLDSSESSLEENGPNEVKQLILRHGFQALKNLILLGFNYLQFIKQYLKNCLVFFIKTPGLRKHLVLIMIRQTIEVGLFLKHCDLVVEKGKNFLNISKHRLLNEEILKFQYDQEVKDLMEKDPVMKKKIEVIEEMWIFLNPEYAKIMLSYRHYFLILKNIQNIFLNQFSNLGSGQLTQQSLIYIENSQLIRKYSSIKFLFHKNDITPQSQSIQNSAHQNYIKLILGENENHCFMFHNIQIRIDANFLILIEKPVNDRTRHFAEKILNKIKLITKIQSLSVFIFLRQQFQNEILNDTKNDTKNSYLLDLITKICMDQTYDRISLLSAFEKIFYSIRKDKIGFIVDFKQYFLLRQILRIGIKSIRTHGLQMMNWESKQIKIYEISYMNNVTQMINLFYKICKIYSKIKGQPNSDIQQIYNKYDITNVRFESQRQMMNQLLHEMENIQQKQTNNKKLKLFNRYISLEIKQFFHELINDSSNENFALQYILSLNQIVELILQVNIVCWQQIDFTSFGFRYYQSWYLTVFNIIANYQNYFFSNPIAHLPMSSIQKMMLLGYEFLKIEQQYKQIVNFIKRQNNVNHLLDNLITSLVLALYSEMNLKDYPFNALGFQNKQIANYYPAFYFNQVSQYLPIRIVDYLVQNILKSKYIPKRYIFFMTLKLFEDHTEYFNLRIAQKIQIIFQLFHIFNLNENDLGIYKQDYMCQLYIQYVLSFHNFNSQQNSNLKNIIFPTYIIRKIIRFSSNESLFNRDDFKNLIKSFIGLQHKCNYFTNKQSKSDSLIVKSLVKKRLIYISARLVTTKIFNQLISQINQLDYEQLDKFIRQNLLKINKYKYSLEKPTQRQKHLFLKFFDRKRGKIDYQNHEQQQYNIKYQKDNIRKQKVIQYHEKKISLTLPIQILNVFSQVIKQMNEQWKHISQSQQHVGPLRIFIDQDQQKSVPIPQFKKSLQKLFNLKIKLFEQFQLFQDKPQILQAKGNHYEEYIKQFYQYSWKNSLI